MEKIAEGFKGEKAIVTPYSIRKIQAENELTKSLFVTHIGYYPYAKYHFMERPMGANENIIIFCDQGEGYVTIETETFFLNQNKLIIIPAHLGHSYSAELKKPWCIYWIHFSGENAHLYSPIMRKVIDLNDDKNKERINLFEAIYQNLEMGYYLDNLEYSSSCLQYLLSSIKCINQFSRTTNLQEMDIVEKSIIFMRENLNNNLTLEQIAQHVGYSSSYFGALFTEKTSFSPIVYYNQLKIQKACSLLQFSKMKIKEISYYLGYYDQFHFSKSFIKEMEISPKEYRLRYQKKSDI